MSSVIPATRSRLGRVVGSGAKRMAPSGGPCLPSTAGAFPLVRPRHPAVFEMCCSGVRFRMAAVLATLGVLRLDGALRALAQSLELVSRSRNGSSQRERHSTVTRKRLRCVPKFVKPEYSKGLRQSLSGVFPASGRLRFRRAFNLASLLANPTAFHDFVTAAHARSQLTPSSRESLMPRSLYENCQHVRMVTTPKGSRFVLCTRSTHDARFPKYPPLLVTRCDGFEETASSAAPLERS